MVMVMNLWTKLLPTTPETPLTRCSQLHGNGIDANTCHQQQRWYESFEFQEALRQEHVSFVQPRIHSSLKSSRNL